VHSCVLAALWRSALPAAYAALRHNMEIGRGPIVEWLKQREAAQGKEMHK
jgi:hypothetical protein